LLVRLPENDYVSQTITHRLYSANVATKVAQFILLGVGGAVMDELNFNPDVYHLNETHSKFNILLIKIWKK
jgi:starch phosphorylase